MALAIFLLLGLLLSSSCEAYKALVVFGMPSTSHFHLGNGVVRNLLKDGHEVTYITPIEYKNAQPNLRQIDVSSNFDVLPTYQINLKHLMEAPTPSGHRKFVKLMLINLVVKTLEHENVQRLLNDTNEHFDVVIVEHMMADLSASYATIFDCPLIWVSPVEVNALSIGLIDVLPNPAYTTDAMALYTAPFTFLERLEELWMRISDSYNDYMVYEPTEEAEYQRLIVPQLQKRGRQAPPYSEVRYNATLVLGNSHVSTGIALGLPQNYKSIGGYHIEEEVKPLPEDLEKIMMNSKNGVIYFSMGSNLKSKDWPEEIKRDLLKLFGELKQTVIWKFEEELPNVPKNVHILKWAPQPSILAHPKCVLFITHGGLLSTTETIHYGVPTIAIPVFGDQFINVKKAVARGYALEVKLSHSIAAELKVAIQEMLNNPKYRQRVKELSYIYHDRPVKPGAELRHWVQHVVNTRGAPHLRSPALQVPLYQRLYLDLAALLLVVILVLKVLLRNLYHRIRPKKTNVNIKKKDKKN
ncbi:UDP-glucuronosyltransferase 1-1-like isoform X2 [Spodoptera litura]|nr:UDP-glucuronosyltransferase 1-1-like isoform X2 [Spodoptera litura]XP_022815546.1 UDP-glucuronosyltransferase 1-1-like isoform X2 [Spodoptera litura]